MEGTACVEYTGYSGELVAAAVGEVLLLMGDAATAHESDRALAAMPVRMAEAGRFVGSYQFGEPREAA